MRILPPPWGSAIHWYVSNDYEAASRVHARYPDKPVLFTEGCWEGGDKIGAWEHGEGYARHMIGDFRNWVCGYVDWNIVLDQRGGSNHVGNFCDAPVMVDTRTQAVRYGPSFYYIGHFSRFVKPGAQRIAIIEGPSALPSVAFINPDGSLVTVALNETNTPLNFTLGFGRELLSCLIPARSIQTYIRRAP